MAALGAVFALLMGLTLASEAGFLASAQGNDRRARLAVASHQLPVLYVVVLAISGAALIVNATALTLRSGWRPAALIGGLAVVVGLGLALLFALGTPWRRSQAA